MDDRQFDSLVMTLTSIGGSRRRMLQALGASGLAAVLGKFGLADHAEAKKKRKKKKKCKNGTTKCGKKACCRADQLCENGTCVDKGIVECTNDDDCRGRGGEDLVCRNGVCVDDGIQGECQSTLDCLENEICINRKCLCAFPSKPCGGLCCLPDEACVNGQCVIGQGTCAAGQSICDEHNVTCNGTSGCTCGDRLDDSAPRCIQFLNDNRDNCTCSTDFQCEVDFPGQGAICIKGGDSCECRIADLGRCARLCPGSS